MFKSISYQEFLDSSGKTRTAVLFIRENECQFCKIAELEMKTMDILAKFNDIDFFQLSIDDEPDLPGKLSLVGVPAFLKIDSSGSKQIKTGFESIESLTQFLLRN